MCIGSSVGGVLDTGAEGGSLQGLRHWRRVHDRSSGGLDERELAGFPGPGFRVSSGTTGFGFRMSRCNTRHRRFGSRPSCHGLHSRQHEPGSWGHHRVVILLLLPWKCNPGAQSGVLGLADNRWPGFLSAEEMQKRLSTYFVSGDLACSRVHECHS